MECIVTTVPGAAYRPALAPRRHLALVARLVGGLAVGGVGGACFCHLHGWPRSHGMQIKCGVHCGMRLCQQTRHHLLWSTGNVLA